MKSPGSALNGDKHTKWNIQQYAQPSLIKLISEECSIAQKPDLIAMAPCSIHTQQKHKFLFQQPHCSFPIMVTHQPFLEILSQTYKTPFRHPRPSLSSGREIVRPALLLWPQLLVVRLGVDLQLLDIGVDDFLTAVGALFPPSVSS